jgi:hypothetical protein
MFNRVPGLKNLQPNPGLQRSNLGPYGDVSSAQQLQILKSCRIWSRGTEQVHREKMCWASELKPKVGFGDEVGYRSGGAVVGREVMLGFICDSLQFRPAMVHPS